MITEAQLIDIGRQAVALSSAELTEAVLTGGANHLTRFANNTIHQNVSQADVDLRVRAAFGKRVGVATTNDLSEAGIRRCVENAANIARHQAEDPDFIGLPEPAEYHSIAAACDTTVAFGPEQRAEAVASILAVAERDGLVASGAFATTPQALAVVNSLGVAARQAFAAADLNITMTGPTSTGRAACTAMDVAEVDAAQAAERAARKALASADPVTVEPGDYTIVLEEDAVGDLIGFLGYMGFGGKAFNEGRSFLSGKLGERVCGESITICDDGLDPGFLPLPFDFEGVPRRKVVVIDRGIARGVVHDRTTAAQAGVESTGHATPPPGAWGPYPMHLKLAPGDATLDEMIASTERGLLVTRFHYTNIVHPLRTELTGMTRDGTFLIEDGKLTRGVKNLRFTQSVLAALSNVEMIGKTPRIAEGCLVPALKVGSFHFSGATEF
ncbi:MAG: TldD/PmbA family protein [Armatimonadetes bacterium]|nr:TldD/PmbA family protein [Armatimonadota bacterium]